MASRPASLESWTCEGSRTMGRPKESKHSYQARGILIDCLPGRKPDQSTHQVRRARTPSVPEPAPGVGPRPRALTPESFGAAHDRGHAHPLCD
jgi:hypothetical protein